MQLFDDKTVPARTRAANVLSHGHPGNDGIRGQRGQLVGQSLGPSLVEILRERFFPEQQPGFCHVGQNQVCPLAEGPHPVNEFRGHGGVGLAVIPHHRVHHFLGRRPQVKGFFRNRRLRLAAEVSGINTVKFQSQLPVMLQRGHAVITAVQPGRGAKPARMGREQHSGQRHRLHAHDRQHRQDDCQTAPPHPRKVVDAENFLRSRQFQQKRSLLRRMRCPARCTHQADFISV